VERLSWLQLFGVLLALTVLLNAVTGRLTPFRQRPQLRRNATICLTAAIAAWVLFAEHERAAAVAMGVIAAGALLASAKPFPAAPPPKGKQAGSGRYHAR
jgi:hypothetical protein